MKEIIEPPQRRYIFEDKTVLWAWYLKSLASTQKSKGPVLAELRAASPAIFPQKVETKN